MNRDVRHLCFVLPKFAPEAMGGAELQVLYLARELLSQGIRVSYIREWGHASPAPTRDGFIGLMDVPRIRFFFLQWLNVFHVRRAMKRVGADAYYCRVSQSYASVVEFWAHRSGAKVVWACSHDREVEPFKTRTDRAWKRVFERLEYRWFSHALKRMDVRFVQSEVQKASLKSTHGLDSIVRENAHPLPSDHHREKTDTVLWVANFRAFKRPELFVELAKKMPYRCVMVGHISDERQEIAFKQSISDVSNLEYAGRLDVDHVNQLMTEARVFVNTSEQEGFPNTFIQAWLRGVPVASLAVDPNGLIRDFGLGIVEPDLDILTRTIRRWMEVPDEWNRLSTTCEEFALERFSIGPYADHVLSEINQA